ncbi:MAG: hypothetical protein JOZ87_06550, partial [Chloroflexi bacterium]|nr:hypothetical protein [Chloroflexota bacterium]
MRLANAIGVVAAAFGLTLILLFLPGFASGVPAALSQAAATLTPAPLPVPILPRSSTGTGYTITFVARWCSAYSDIMANNARNNLQENLAQLGINSQYSSGSPINPTVETQFDPNCHPFPPGVDGNQTGWTFELGQGYQNTNKVNNLSTITQPIQTVTTQATNGTQPAGSVTLALTSQEVTLAQNHNLWVMGGTVANPLNQNNFGNLYGLGALRCAIDNLNADNVETVSFPSGQKNVYCYYYAVSPAPGYGTINVTKRTTNGNTSTTFPFHGSVSFNNSPVQGYFALTPNQQMTFTRAAGSTWDMTEDVPGGWSLTGYTCTSTSGTSTITYPPDQPGTSVIALANLDTVNCTYTDSPLRLTVDKVSVGGTGGPFNFQVTAPAGSPSGQYSATTTVAGVPARVYQDTAGNSAQPYTFTEAPPPGWALTGVTCTSNSNLVWPASGDPNTFSVTVSNGATQACTVTDTLAATGGLVINKTTQASTGGPFTYIVASPDGTVQKKVAATTTAVGTAVTATGDDLSKLQPGDYTITEFPPVPAGLAWASTSITCAGATPPVSGAAVTVTIVAGQTVTCAYTDTLSTYTPTPTVTTTPTPTPNVPGAIRVTKLDRDTQAPLAGGVFTITGPNAYSASVTTGADGTACVDGLPFGTYSVHETTPPYAYELDTTQSVDVVVDHGATCASGAPSTPPPFTNPHAGVGAIVISKASSTDSTPLAGATFSIVGPNAYSTSVSTGADGTVCVNPVTYGTFQVTETVAPPGYQIDSSVPVSVQVSQPADCVNNLAAAVQVPFTDSGLAPTATLTQTPTVTS